MNLDLIVKQVMMSDSDTVFVDCNDGEVNDREPSVEVIDRSSGNGEIDADQDESGKREDIVQVSSHRIMRFMRHFTFLARRYAKALCMF